MSTVFQRGRARIEANLTPMIDVTFLLIVFFVLVSQIVEVENVPMSLPEPDDPATEIAGDEQRAVINVIPGPQGGCHGYRVGTQVFASGDEGVVALEQHLTRVFGANPQIHVNLRADRATHYRYVEPVLQAIVDASREAGVDVGSRVNFVVVRAES